MPKSPIRSPSARRFRRRSTRATCNPVGPFGAGQNAQLGADQGFLCPCHGSTFDLAGRVFKNKPAPDNLVVPPHKYLSDTVVLIGDDSNA